MIRFAFALLIFLGVILTNCSPSQSDAASSSTPEESTASISTIEPVIITSLPADYTPPPTSLLPTQTSIPTLQGGLSPTELKYQVLEEFPDFFFCDPDYYPVAHDNEAELALQRFPELQANKEEFNAILAHNDLAGKTAFSDEEKLLIYREHKKLAALLFELIGESYQFQITVAEAEGEGELVTAQIDAQGSITVLEKAASIATCPICLAVGTLIDAPSGSIPVQSLRLGDVVWTLDSSGRRVAQPVVEVSKAIVPASHQVIHLVLGDGREVWISPGHPTADGRTIGELQAGDNLEGGIIVYAHRVEYIGSATYDLLPDGDTGFYWANGILLASTLDKMHP